LATSGTIRPQAVLGHSKVTRDGTPVPVPAPAPVRFRTTASPRS
jgi:hypothetical protein